MSGMSDYSAKNWLNYTTLQAPNIPTPTGVWLALMTAVDTDAGTGGTEVSGGSYARVQVAGTVAATASWTTSTTNITMTTNPGWVVAGMNVFDSTNNNQIGTVSTYVGTALVLTANAAHASTGSTDNLVFSAFAAATGSAPSSISNTNAIITFALSTASWGTAIAWELRDALTSGNLLAWDYLGNNAWFPATVSAASPGVITAHAHGYSNGNSFVFSTEYGGTAPTFSAGNYTGLQTVAGVTTDTFNVTGVNTSATGNGMVRAVSQQVIPNNNTVYFAAGSLTISAA
jgi:hypothetical protein